MTAKPDPRLRTSMGLVLLACVPLLAWSRLRLARHTWAEVVGGSVLGALAGAPLLP